MDKESIVHSPGEPGPGWAGEGGQPHVVLLEVVLLELVKGLLQAGSTPPSRQRHVNLDNSTFLTQLGLVPGVRT